MAVDKMLVAFDESEGSEEGAKDCIWSWLLLTECPYRSCIRGADSHVEL